MSQIVPTAYPNRAPSARTMTWAALLIIGALAFVAMPGWLFAADTRSGNNVTVPVTETVTGDLYLAGSTVDFLGVAERDVNIGAGEATISGTIRGSLSLAAGQATITGPVSGSVKILGGTVTLSGNVGGDVVMLGGRLEVTSSARINGSILLAGGQLDMRGQVTGDIQGYVASSSIGGTVTGSVDLWTGNLEITNTARITGDVSVTGKQDAAVDSEAQVTGSVVHSSPDPWGEGDNPIGRASGNLLRTLWMLVTGGLLVLLAPRLAQYIGANGRRLIPAIPLGVLAAFAIPVLAIVLMVTVIGLPAGVMLITLFMMMLYVTHAVVGLAIGQFLLPRAWRDGSRGFNLLAMTLGVLIIAAFRFVPLPWVWAAISALVTVWGIGAVLMLLPRLSRRDVTSGI